jgi:endonuclease YncB( thermonuclease family)
MRYFTIFLTILSLLPSAVFAESFSGKVVGVADGDTISVMRLGRAEKVRLSGIDAPEKNSPSAIAQSS